MTVKELFDFVTDPTVNDDNINDYLDRAMKIASTRTLDNAEKVNDEVSSIMFHHLN
jgi:RIO kinase 1